MTDPDGFVAVLLGFARTLRHAGVPATPDRVQAMIAALDHLDVLVATDVYWAGRLTLCADPADLERYDVAFAAYFGGRALPMPPVGAPPARSRSVEYELEDELGIGEQADEPSQAVQASRLEALRHRDMAVLTPAERDEINRLFELLTPRVGQRRTRRYRPSNRGRVDLGRTVREVLRHGGEPA